MSTEVTASLRSSCFCRKQQTGPHLGRVLGLLAIRPCMHGDLAAGTADQSTADQSTADQFAGTGPGLVHQRQLERHLPTQDGVERRRAAPRDRTVRHTEDKQPLEEVQTRKSIGTGLLAHAISSHHLDFESVVEAGLHVRRSLCLCLRRTCKPAFTAESFDSSSSRLLHVKTWPRNSILSFYTHWYFIFKYV